MSSMMTRALPPAEQGSVRVAKGLLRYLVAVVVLSIGTTFASNLGSGLPLVEAVVGALLAEVWVGWILALVGVPIAALYLALLYVLMPRYTRPTRLLALALSALVWALVALALVTLGVATRSSQANGQPLSVSDAIVGVAGSACLGVFLGVPEAIVLKNR